MSQHKILMILCLLFIFKTSSVEVLHVSPNSKLTNWWATPYNLMWMHENSLRFTVSIHTKWNMETIDYSNHEVECIGDNCADFHLSQFICKNRPRIDLNENPYWNCTGKQSPVIYLREKFHVNYNVSCEELVSKPTHFNPNTCRITYSTNFDTQPEL